MQRKMVGTCLRVLRRHGETLEVYCRRRERLITRTIRDNSRSLWGRLQQYRHMMFLGHLARMPVGERLASRALHWRSHAWWEYYRRVLPPLQRGQRGRRRAWVSTPGRTGRAVSDAFAAALDEDMAHMYFARMVMAIGRWPTGWMDIAQDRESWRHLCRWRVFAVRLADTPGPLPRVGVA